MSGQETIGIVGYGHIAQRHLNVILGLKPDCRVVLLTRRSANKICNHKNVLVLNCLEDFLKTQPTHILVSTAASDHAEFIERLSEANSIILIEKPIAANLSQAQRIKDVCQKKTSKIFVGYNLRFTSSYQILKQHLKSEKFGRLMAIHSVVGHSLEYWRPDRDLSNVPSSQKSSGGGVLRELSHEIDLMFNLLGNPFFKSLTVANLKFKNFDVEDTAIVQMGFNIGGVALASLHLDFIRQDRTRCSQFVGSNQTLVWDLLSGKIEAKSNLKSEVVCVVNDDIEKSYVLMWKALFEDDFTLFCTVDEAISVLKHIEDMEANCDLVSK